MAVLDPRTWLPLVAACAVFASRECMVYAVPAATQPARSTAMPQPHGGNGAVRKAGYELDRARSSVRFLLRSEAGESLFQCPLVHGRFTSSPDDAETQLDLEFDLGSLVPVDTSGATDSLLELRELLGVNRAETVHYHASLVSRASTPLPGLLQLVWQGHLHFGGRTVRQPMSLWQTQLPGLPPRLQGHGTVPTDAYGLGRSAWFGLVQDRHVVTLGIDLAWKRVGAN